uniref:Uncharacterized protein n=1 Tax=Rhabditophanes sp. KR3021 TaxID=114890 RepID=A0AC35U7Z8_9BILA
MIICVKNNQNYLEIKYPMKTFLTSRIMMFELAHSCDKEAFYTITDFTALFERQNATIFSSSVEDDKNEVATLMTDLAVKAHVKKVILQLAKYTESIKNSIRALVPKMIMNMLLGSCLNKSSFK